MHFFGDRTAVEIYARPTTSMEPENAKADIEVNRARYQWINTYTRYLTRYDKRSILYKTLRIIYHAHEIRFYAAIIATSDSNSRPALLEFCARLHAKEKSGRPIIAHLPRRACAVI